MPLKTMHNRLKGQDIEICFRVGTLNKFDTIINAIGSFNEQLMVEKLQDGFLGETADRFDDIYKGTSFDMEFQVHNAEWLVFTELIQKRARRELSDLVFEVIRHDHYQGNDARVTYTDVKWGAISTGVASRSDFVKVKIEGACSERIVNIGGVM